MADVEKRVVWVLGAGFSAGLGGPLLTRLLSERSEPDLAVRYPRAKFERLYGDAPRVVRQMYRSGLQDALWGDAEDFIDYLDTAVEDRAKDAPNHHRDRLEPVRASLAPAVSLKAVHGAARRLVAAECCGFLESVDPKRETWKPYRNWMRSLRPSDTVITFNYDRVIEMLEAAQNAEATSTSECAQIKVLLPGHVNGPKTWQGCTPVLKMHGSVDWQKATVNGRVVIQAMSDKLFALTCPDDQLAIATPGPSKMVTARRFFPELWKLAGGALREADVIVFIGYRFPETDADAREQLLEAIGLNGSRDAEVRPNLLSLHIVLGNDCPLHAERLAALLRFVCKRFRHDVIMGIPYAVSVTTHPLYAQDFFTVARRDDL